MMAYQMSSHTTWGLRIKPKMMLFIKAYKYLNAQLQQTKGSTGKMCEFIFVFTVFRQLEPFCQFPYTAQSLFPDTTKISTLLNPTVQF